VSTRAQRILLVALLVGGVGAMVPFEGLPSRVIGMALLGSFIVLGVFLIAQPGFLTGDEDA
jgi:hypothetical protein